MTQTTERRLFQRIDFDNRAELAIAGSIIDCQLVDLSLQGALVNSIEMKQLEIGEKGTLRFNLGDDEHTIEMNVEVAHQEQKHIGLHCLHTDLESMSHLRRIIELNTGDSQLLQREFSSLLKSN